MIYVWVGIALVALFLVVRLFKNINSAKVEASKTERRIAWYDFRKYRRDNSIFGRRRRNRSQPIEPTPDVESNDNGK